MVYVRIWLCLVTSSRLNLNSSDPKRQLLAGLCSHCQAATGKDPVKVTSNLHLNELNGRDQYVFPLLCMQQYTHVKRALSFLTKCNHCAGHVRMAYEQGPYFSITSWLCTILVQGLDQLLVDLTWLDNGTIGRFGSVDRYRIKFSALASPSLAGNEFSHTWLRAQSLLCSADTYPVHMCKNCASHVSWTQRCECVVSHGGLCKVFRSFEQVYVLQSSASYIL